MEEDKIKKFWEWFSKNESMIAPGNVSDVLVSIIS